VIEKWRVRYNTERPHSALGYRPPAPAACNPWMPNPNSQPLAVVSTSYEVRVLIRSDSFCMVLSRKL
jgi:hypothetical protein